MRYKAGQMPGESLLGEEVYDGWTLDAIIHDPVRAFHTFYFRRPARGLARSLGLLEDSKEVTVSEFDLLDELLFKCLIAGLAK